MRTPASNSRPWCEAWDRASKGLLAELSSPRPHPLRIREFIDRRQRLMTAQPRPEPQERWSGAAQKQWLSFAVEREEEIQVLFGRYRSVVAKAVYTFQAGGKARRTYHGESPPAPGRSLDKIT